MGSHLCDLLITAVFEREIYTRQNDTSNEFKCTVCSSTFEFLSEQFNIDLQVDTFIFKKIIANQIGLTPQKIPGPAGGGLFGFEDQDIETIQTAVFVDGTFEDLKKYLTAKLLKPLSA